MTRRVTMLLFLAALAVILGGGPAAAARQDAGDVETDPLVLKKLDWFQDLKFGLMMHWGPYSQWGVVESWSICSEDEPWCRRNIPDYVEYKRRYEALPGTFNPVKFDPGGWAREARQAGMRYVVFTAKHHDGFAMFDTAQTEYRITGPGVPFASNPRANVVKEIFAAFRAEGLGTGAYFSKPDWHSPDYWAPEWATPDRNVNYDPARYPERWTRFKEFTFKQIEELMSGYGPVDILWLDGGWVRPYPVGPPALRGLLKQPFNQDIDLPRIAAMARSRQPGLIIVDRTVSGRYENYRTPEQEIPEKPLPYVWETCLTMGDSWSYVPHDSYKSPRRLVHLLADIVAKGGNLLLNIGPNAEGELPAEALLRLREIGAWMKVNAEAIHGTRPVAPFQEAKIRFTAGRNGARYAIYLADEDEAAPPGKILLHAHAPGPGGRVEMLGAPRALKWEPAGKGALIDIPAAVREAPPCRFAWVLKIT